MKLIFFIAYNGCLAWLPKNGWNFSRLNTTMWSIIWWQWNQMDIQSLVLNKRHLGRSYIEQNYPKKWYWFLGMFSFGIQSLSMCKTLHFLFLYLILQSRKKWYSSGYFEYVGYGNWNTTIWCCSLVECNHNRFDIYVGIL